MSQLEALALVDNVADAVIDNTTAIRLAEIFAALADPNRLRIVSALSLREYSVGELSRLVEMSESATSHQLRLLRTQHIVRSRRAGRQIFYALDDDHIFDLLSRGIAHIQHR
jgi:ArsR family transcriptional regulator, lead/cadmium/zinc/bismuth-responsive transcriptional repressor